MQDFIEWALATFSSAGVIAFAAYIFRDAVSKFFSKIVENRFERKMEVFKAEIRDKEKELEQIMTFLVSARRERDSAIMAKKMEAAEAMLRFRQHLSQLAMLVEYMKIINTEEMLKRGEDTNVAEFASTLIRPFKIDEKLEEFKKFDQVLPNLYLSEATIKRFDIYTGIITSAIMMMKIFSLPMKDKHSLIKGGNLGKKISDLLPNTKESFEKWGEGYAYHWAQYFYDEVLKSLRNEVSGVDDVSRDTRSIEKLAIDSRLAQINIRTSLLEAGLPDILITHSDSVAQK